MKVLDTVTEPTQETQSPPQSPIEQSEPPNEARGCVAVPPNRNANYSRLRRSRENIICYTTTNDKLASLKGQAKDPRLRPFVFRILSLIQDFIDAVSQRAVDS